MAFSQLRFEVIRVRRWAESAVDELGNDLVASVEDRVRVAGWAVPRTDEPKLAGHARRTVEVELYAPVGLFQPLDAVRLPGRKDVLEVVGEPENYENSAFGWSPGLEVINLAGVI